MFSVTAPWVVPDGEHFIFWVRINPLNKVVTSQLGQVNVFGF